MKKGILLSTFLCLFSILANAQITLTQFNNSNLSAPVDIKNCGDDRSFIVQQAGTIVILDTLGLQFPRPFMDITTRVQYGGEQGLLGLAFAPDYATSRYFYVNYTAKPSGDTRISRFRTFAANPDSADPNSEEILLTIYQPFSNILQNQR